MSFLSTRSAKLFAPTDFRAFQHVRIGTDRILRLANGLIESRLLSIYLFSFFKSFVINKKISSKFKLHSRSIFSGRLFYIPFFPESNGLSKTQGTLKRKKKKIPRKWKRRREFLASRKKANVM